MSVAATKTMKKPEFRLISEDKVPVKLRRSSQQWLNILRSIPEGKALVATEDELGVKSSSVKFMVDRLKKAGLLKGNYYTTRRTVEDVITVFVVHSAKLEGESK